LLVRQLCLKEMISLARRMNASGYTVSLGADTEFEALVRDNGIRYLPVRLDLRGYFSSDEGKAALNKGTQGAKNVW
jgi:hypothetical protein